MDVCREHDLKPRFLEVIAWAAWPLLATTLTPLLPETARTRAPLRPVATWLGRALPAGLAFVLAAALATALFPPLRNPAVERIASDNDAIHRRIVTAGNVPDGMPMTATLAGYVSRPVARFRAGDADGRAWAYGARADQPRLVFDLITPVTWFGRRLGAQFCVLVPANGAATDWPPGTPVRVHGRLEFTPSKPYSGRYLLVADRVERLAAAGAPAGDGAAAAPAPRSGARGG